MEHQGQELVYILKVAGHNHSVKTCETIRKCKSPLEQNVNQSIVLDESHTSYKSCNIYFRVVGGCSFWTILLYSGVTN